MALAEHNNVDQFASRAILSSDSAAPPRGPWDSTQAKPPHFLADNEKFKTGICTGGLDTAAQNDIPYRPLREHPDEVSALPSLLGLTSKC